MLGQTCGVKLPTSAANARRRGGDRPLSCPLEDDRTRAAPMQQRPGWRNAKHARDWPRSLRAYAFPRIGALPVSAVTTADVLAILTPIWCRKHSSYSGSGGDAGSRTRSRVFRQLTDDA